MKKRGFWGLRPGKIQTGLFSFRSLLESWNFGFSKYRYNTIYAVNNKGTDQTVGMRRLICTFVVRMWHKAGFLITWLRRFSKWKHTSAKFLVYPTDNDNEFDDADCCSPSVVQDPTGPEILSKEASEGGKLSWTIDGILPSSSISEKPVHSTASQLLHVLSQENLMTYGPNVLPIKQIRIQSLYWENSNIGLLGLCLLCFIHIYSNFFS